MAKTKNEENFLKFNFDVSAFRLLGRELITDRITALFELVKNSYDSNANDVTIEFIKIIWFFLGQSKISLYTI